MSSIQDKLELASQKIRNKLFDNSIKLLGQAAEVLRLKVDKNQYEDADIKIISHDIIECILSYPGNIPLKRERQDFANEETQNDKVYLFDIVPIDFYTKWTDNVERYDIIVHKIKTEKPNDYIKMVLQVSDTVGSFKSSLLYKKNLCFPYSGPLADPIQRAIESF